VNDEKLKDNYCTIFFLCDEKRDVCVNRKNKKKCKYFKSGHCTSCVAQIQSISRYCKHIGLNVTAEGIK
jgi:hypothetical protein